jgi:thiol:disulfide interchange protein
MGAVQAVRSRPRLRPVLVLLLAVGVLVAVQIVRQRPVPAPACFDPSMSLEDAEQRAERAGRAVVVLATAPWCGPCRSFKAGALADARVARWIDDHAVGVVLDAEARPDDIRRLGIRAFPTLLVIRGGTVVAATVGEVSAEELLRRLERAGDGAAGTPATPAGG